MAINKIIIIDDKNFREIEKSFPNEILKSAIDLGIALKDSSIVIMNQKENDGAWKGETERISDNKIESTEWDQRKTIKDKKAALELGEKGKDALVFCDYALKNFENFNKIDDDLSRVKYVLELLEESAGDSEIRFILYSCYDYHNAKKDFVELQKIVSDEKKKDRLRHIEVISNVLALSNIASEENIYRVRDLLEEYKEKILEGID